ncbi:MAG: GxxExxY protein, partial [Gemmatimonadetes bacterium]|nr:GxxExxY protein [Gemmatimonadota bacterium]
MFRNRQPRRTKGARGREGSLADRWSGAVIGAAIRVHRALGPGLLESAYQESLATTLDRVGIPFEREFPVPTFFEDRLLATHYRLDFLVGGYLVLELKAVEALQPIHHAQLLTYLRLGNYPMGLLLNFGQPTLKAGLRRFVNSP